MTTTNTASAPVNKIKWVRVEEGESFYASTCKRFELIPLYLGRVRPQGFKVIDNVTGASKVTYCGLKWAKDIANDFNAKSL